MRLRPFLLGCAALLAASCSSASIVPVDLAREEQAIRDLDARWLKAAQSRDAAGEAAVFASDGVAYREHMEPIVGPPAVEAYVAKFTRENAKANVTWSTDAVAFASAGDLAVQTGTYHLTALGGGDGEDTGRFVTVWRKENGAWKVTHDIGSTTTPSAASDTAIGTWELNVSKSTYSPGPGPKSETRTYVASGQEIKASSTGVDRSGKPATSAWVVNYDGNDHPETGNADADALLVKRVDANTTAYTEKRAGKVVITGTRTISPDGKLLTLVSKGTNARGQEFSDTQVFDRR